MPPWFSELQVVCLGKYHGKKKIRDRVVVVVDPEEVLQGETFSFFIISSLK